MFFFRSKKKVLTLPQFFFFPMCTIEETSLYFLSHKHVREGEKISVKWKISPFRQLSLLSNFWNFSPSRPIEDWIFPKGKLTTIRSWQGWQLFSVTKTKKNKWFWTHFKSRMHNGNLPFTWLWLVTAEHCFLNWYLLSLMACGYSSFYLLSIPWPLQRLRWLWVKEKSYRDHSFSVHAAMAASEWQVKMLIKKEDLCLSA